MNEALCNERHKSIEETLKEHSKDIGDLKTSDAVNRTNIEVLCKKLGGLTTAIWGLVVVMVGGFVTFYFNAVQSHIK